MHRNVRENEPSLALFVDDTNPLIFYKQILSLAKGSISTNGMIFFEINEHFGAEVVDLCLNAGYTRAELFKDLNGKNRMVLATF